MPIDIGDTPTGTPPTTGEKLQIRTAIGLGQTDAPTFLAQTLTGQSLTGVQATSLLDLSTTWLSTTGAPTAIKLNVTDTASNAASKLMDLQVGGASLISIEKSGLIVARASSTSTNTNPLTAPNGITFAGSNGRIYISSPQSPGNGLMVWQDNGAGTVMFLNNQFLRIQNTTLLQWCSPDSGLTPSLSLAQDAAGILAQRNGTAKQVHRVYNTFLGTTANEWGGFDWLTTTNTLRIGTEHGGTGTARPIDFVTGGVVRMSINATDATFSVTLKAAALSTYAGTGWILGLDAAYNTGIRFQSFTDSVLVIRNAAATDLARVCLGGTTSAFPAIKRSTTYLQAKLADDSAFTNIQGKLTTDTAYTATVVAATGYITIYDSTGQAYRVPCAV
jgi:hypothetical protein